MSENKKFCTNCRNYRPDNMWWVLAVPVIGWIFFLLWRLGGSAKYFAKCTAIPEYDRVSGKKSFYHCSTCRAFSCGDKARYFEPRRG